MGDVLVTRHFSANFGQECSRFDRLAPFFVDWLSLSQSHDFDVPEVNAGVVMGIDAQGQLDWQVQRASKIEGSYDTSVQVRSDGRTVTFSGNVSRFGRSNNLWGYDLNVCILKVNRILAKLGLPPYSMGRKHYVHSRTQQGVIVRPAWTGCKITRLDLTANYQTGSESNARAYLEWLQTQQGTRLKVGTHADGETVDWGRGSRRIYSKVYLKSAELIRHHGPKELIDYCNEVGLVRFEVTLKATQLYDMGCNYLGGLDMAELIKLFEDKRAVLTRAEHTVDDLENLPNAFRRTARDYLAGDDLTRTLSDRTFRRHRAAILPYGIDIAVKRNVINFRPKIRVIEVKPAIIPHWYNFDQERFAA